MLLCVGVRALDAHESWCSDRVVVLLVRSACCLWILTVVRTLAGGLNGTFAAYADGTGSLAGFNMPYGVAVDASGNTYVADLLNHRVRKVTPGGGANISFFFSSWIR
jgi:hypothetical protein